MTTISTPQGFPIEPRMIQTVKQPRFIMNHTYRDFSSMPRVVGDNETDALPLEQMTFPRKVYHMLNSKKFEGWIDWMPHGRAFRINVPKKLEEEVLESYFGHKRYSSFLRQLSNHGFKHISQGADRNCFYHELMLNGMPHLCKYFVSPKDARRSIPDPGNEPDFYAITKNHPLPKYTSVVVSVESQVSTGSTTSTSSTINENVRSTERKRLRGNTRSVSVDEDSALPLNKRRCRYTESHVVDAGSSPVHQAEPTARHGEDVVKASQSPLSVPSKTTTQSSLYPLSPVSSNSTDSMNSEMRQFHQSIDSNNQLIALLLLQTQFGQRQQNINNQTTVNNGNQLLQQQVITAFLAASGLLQQLQQ